MSCLRLITYVDIHPFGVIKRLIFEYIYYDWECGPQIHIISSLTGTIKHVFPNKLSLVPKEELIPEDSKMVVEKN